MITMFLLYCFFLAVYFDMFVKNGLASSPKNSLSSIFGRVGLFLQRFLSHSLINDILLQAPFLLCCNWLVGWTCYWIHYRVYYTSNAYKWVFFFRLLMLRPSSGLLYCSKWSGILIHYHVFIFFDEQKRVEERPTW